MTKAETMATWCSTLCWSDIPGTLQTKAQSHLLDTFGAAIAGRSSRPVQIAEQVFNAPGPARLLTGGTPRDVRHAARINAISAHALEIDDTEGCDHSGAVVVPVLLAMSDIDPTAPGDRILTALIAGYEIGRRIQLALGGYDAHNDSGWHSTGTCGVFAAATAAAVMLDLNPQQSASALAIAASSSAGGWAFARNGALTKQLHPANAAANGMDAALLARAGAEGPLEVFESVWGNFFQTHGNKSSRAESLIDGLGSVWHFGHSAVKPYASCRSTHSAIDATREMMTEQELCAGDITGIELRVNSFLSLMICPAQPSTIAAARMSLPVCLALLMQGKGLVPEDFENFSSEATVDWLSRITVVVDDTEPAVEPLVCLRAGQRLFENRRSTARGSCEDPLSPLEIEAKFDSLTQAYISPELARSIKRFVQHLPETRRQRFPELS